MAVEPLFNLSREVLLKRVRIETVSDAQTLALVDQTITEVRVGFYNAITQARAALIASYSLVENPASEQEVLRSTGANTEASWVTWLLAQRLPYLFVDNKASIGDSWNDERLTRDADGLRAFLANLKAQIDMGIGQLTAPVNEEAGLVKAASIAPDEDDLVYSRFLGLYPSGSNIGII